MSETKERELLPCPFCGNDAKVRLAFGFYVLCMDCSVRTPHFDYPEESIAVWNRRAAPVAQWTKEPPTEEGWYLILTKNFYHDLTPSVVIAMIHEEELKFYVSRTTSGWHTLAELLKYQQKIYGWQKIPIPALPEEGGSE